jgi:cell division transport system permease protein
MSRKPSGRIMPPERGTGPLDIVIAVMAFLATLALGASLIANRTAEGWRAGLVGKLTIQIMPADQDPVRGYLQRETAAALDVLHATSGIVFAKALSEADEMALIRPWVGNAESLEEFPLPQLIDADVRPGAGVDMVDLKNRLIRAAPHARLDDHGIWLSRLRDLAGSIVWSAYGILFLIAVATSAAVAFATRARLEAHKDMVGLLHQMGAQSGFIARTFEWHYWRAATSAGLIGAGFAALLFAGAEGLEIVGIEAVPFLPSLSLQPMEFLWLAVVPVGSGAIGLMTARLSVLTFLARIY